MMPTPFDFWRAGFRLWLAAWVAQMALARQAGGVPLPAEVQPAPKRAGRVRGRVRRDA